MGRSRTRIDSRPRTTCRSDVGPEPAADAATLIAVRKQARRGKAHAMEAAVIACVREYPGSTLQELIPLFDINPFELRRHLNELVKDNRILIERRALVRHGGRVMPTYFAPEHDDPPDAEPTPPAHVKKTA